MPLAGLEPYYDKIRKVAEMLRKSANPQKYWIFKYLYRVLLYMYRVLFCATV